MIIDKIERALKDHTNLEISKDTIQSYTRRRFSAVRSFKRAFARFFSRLAYSFKKLTILKLDNVTKLLKEMTLIDSI